MKMLDVNWCEPRGAVNNPSLRVEYEGYRKKGGPGSRGHTSCSLSAATRCGGGSLYDLSSFYIPADNG
ncbi:hypothetical protein J6590_063774 [Homalodisca vitripennis]|nr:hypothetical protein J6590_063774 [Homalodisca vitripennis]